MFQTEESWSNPRFVQLANNIISLSESKSWEDAKLEWTLIRTYFEEDGTCLCGYYPIKERCIIGNNTTQTKVIVGNCCVTRFFDIPANQMFAALGRIVKDPTRSINDIMLDFLYKNQYVDDYQHKFYDNIMNRQWRTLSEKQRAFKVKTNSSIAYRLQNNVKAPQKSF